MVAAHTRVPNLYMDIVLWLLTDVEKDCILYILRKTIGWTDGDGGRKNRDTISLGQFESGIITGQYLFNLGVNRSKGSIRKALEGLAEKDLVDARWSCTNCWWEETENSNLITTEGKCPRCSASLTKSYALADLTPKKIVKLLNENERQKNLGRTFQWDQKMKRFKVIDTDREAIAAAEKEELQQKYNSLYEDVWHQDLIDSAMEKAAQLLKTKKLGLSRKVNGFLIPVVDMQKEFKNPALIKYALEQTLAGPVFQGEVGKKPTNNWFRYTQRVAESSRGQFTGQAPTSFKNEPARIEELTKQRLREAAILNGTGKADQARIILDKMLAAMDTIEIIFDGDKEKAEHAVRLCFKQGGSDVMGVKVDEYAEDFDPEWSP